MEQITAFNKQNLRVLRQEIDQAIAEVGKKHGINLRLGNISFNPEDFKAQLKAVIASNGNGSGMLTKDDEYRNNFQQDAEQWGFDPNDLDRQISIFGRRYTIVGLRRSHVPMKYPVICREERSGKLFQLPIDDVQMGLREMKAKGTN